MESAIFMDLFMGTWGFQCLDQQEKDCEFAARVKNMGPLGSSDCSKSLLSCAEEEDKGKGAQNLTGYGCLNC